MIRTAPGVPGFKRFFNCCWFIFLVLCFSLCRSSPLQRARISPLNLVSERWGCQASDMHGMQQGASYDQYGQGQVRRLMHATDRTSLIT